MRLLSLLLLLLFTNFIFAHNNVFKESAPKWVDEISYNTDNVDIDNGGYQYLLLDFQDNCIEEAYYRHYVLKILNSNGIQSNSDITVEFDPSYQKVFVHKVNVIRDGKIIDKLNLTDFQVLQRESSLERALYDGSLTAVLNLSDVRENDIIEYSYTIKGFNPIYEGLYSNDFYHQYSIPVNRIYNRLVIAKNKNLNYKLFNGAQQPKIETNVENTEYIWDVEALDFKLYEDNLPEWIDIYKKVSISSAKNWSEIVNWALPLYSYNKNSINNIEKEIDKGEDKKQTAEKYIRFVQDHIRYLGFENGINAFRPNKPIKVFLQRYGDCKDKSLLLVSLLREVGIEAYPVLVNTYLRKEITGELPSINLFNHCIVNFSLEGKNYFVDPTISNQGGDLENTSVPDYAYGLLVKEGETDLTIIDPPLKPIINIDEIIKLDSIGGDADYTVLTEYSLAKADGIRNYFKSSSNDAIKKEYTDFYRNLYPRIELAKDVQLVENENNIYNKIVISENYLIRKIWENSTDNDKIYCEMYPLVLESYLNYYQCSNREAPFYLGEPFQYIQTTEINLPEDWSCENSVSTINGIGFKYDNKVICDGRKIKLIHKFDLYKNSIPGDSIEVFLNKIESVKNEMHYYITYNPKFSKYQLSWVSILIAVISTILTIVLSIYIFRNYDPAPLMPDTNKQIGGWMVLPAIGLVLSPLILVSQIFSKDFFNHNTWVGIYSSESSLPFNTIFIVGGEIIYNFFLLSFTIFLIILFFKRRTSVPNIITIYYVVILSASILDLIAVKLIIPDFFDDAQMEESTKIIGRAVVAALIWVPYFQVSQRVKETFCKTYSTRKDLIEE